MILTQESHRHISGKRWRAFHVAVVDGFSDATNWDVFVLDMVFVHVNVITALWRIWYVINKNLKAADDCFIFLLFRNMILVLMEKPQHLYDKAHLSAINSSSLWRHLSSSYWFILWCLLAYLNINGVKYSKWWWWIESIIGKPCWVI